MTVHINGIALPQEAIQFELGRLIKLYSEYLPEDRIAAEMDSLRAKAKDQAVGTLLLRMEADRLDITVSDTEIDAKINEMIESSGGKETFLGLLERQGLALDELRESIRQGGRLDQLVARISVDYTEPNEATVREYYDSHPDDFVHPASALVQHILIRPDSETDEDRAVARSRLMHIRAQISEGADFGDMATAHSHCPSGQASAGNLGWLAPGMMAEAFDEAVASLEKAELSEIIESPLGFHIAYKHEENARRSATYEETGDKIRDLLRHDAKGRLIAEHVEELKEKVQIVDDED
jgi:parvulin-like peptidyl-prolyl isomerase